MPYIIYTDWVGLGQYDVRDVLIRGVGGSTAKMYFCPLWEGFRPEDSPEPTPYTPYFYVSPGLNRHYVGYFMYFLWRDYPWEVDWTPSATPDGPFEPGDADAAIVSDINCSWDTLIPGSTSWQYPELSSHSSIRVEGNAGDVGWVVPAGSFRDSNVLHGDGHVETRRKLKYYVKYKDSYEYYPY